MTEKINFLLLAFMYNCCYNIRRRHYAKKVMKKTLTVTVCFVIALAVVPHMVDGKASKKAKTHITIGRYSACGPEALLYICDKYHISATFQDLCIKANTNVHGTTLVGLAAAAKSVGLQAVGMKMDYKAISALTGPAIAWVDGNHYVAVLSVSGSNVSIYDSAKRGKEKIPVGILLRRSQGIFLLLGRQNPQAQTAR